MAEEHEEEYTAPRRPSQITMDVLAYQMGTFKESLDRGLGGLEKTIEKGLDGVHRRLDAVQVEVKELNGRVSSIERRQEFDAARLKELERYREEQDRIEQERRRVAEAELRANVDNSQAWKTARWMAAFVGGAFMVAGVIATIVSSV